MADVKAGCRTNIATAIELRHNIGWTGLAKEKIAQHAPNVRDAELVSAWVDAWRKTSDDAASAFIATGAWPVEMMKIGNHFKPTHSYATIFPRAPGITGSRTC